MPETHFLIRIEPRDDAPNWDRATLDGAMADHGFRGWVTGPSGAAYQLPAGEYYLAGWATRWDVLERARRAAAATGRRCAVVVAEVTAVLWLGLDPVPEADPAD